MRRGYGHDSSVTAGGTVYPAFGMDFAGNTNGVSGSALALLITVRDDASEELHMRAALPVHFCEHTLATGEAGAVRRGA